MLKIEFTKDHEQTGHKKGDIIPVMGTKLNPGLAKVAKIIKSKDKPPKNKKDGGDVTDLVDETIIDE